ncbi:hypothetical protein FOA20_05595 [Peribacillus simplex]
MEALFQNETRYGTGRKQFFSGSPREPRESQITQIYKDLLDTYNHLVNQRGWPLKDVDDMDIHFYYELLNHSYTKEKANGNTKGKRSRFKDQKVVPIDAVF